MPTTDLKPLDKMREAWGADVCPIEGNFKRDHQDWFCVGCWRALSKEIQNALRHRPERSYPQWMQALGILKERKEKYGTAENSR